MAEIMPVYRVPHAYAEPPTTEGATGAAWEVPNPTAEVLAIRPDWTGCLGTWVVHPAVTPMPWHHYVVSVIHLRPIPGVRPAHIRRPGATHEMIIVALDPSAAPMPLTPMTDPDAYAGSHLSPPNLTHQLVGATDEQARWLLRTLVDAIVGKGINPEMHPRALGNILDATLTHWHAHEEH